LVVKAVLATQVASEDEVIFVIFLKILAKGPSKVKEGVPNLSILFNIALDLHKLLPVFQVAISEDWEVLAVGCK
jgi:hypothetical protein